VRPTGLREKAEQVAKAAEDGPFMSGGAGDIGALLDPGPELSSYDPAWEARWDKANALLRLFRERDPSGSSELAAQLVEELCQACSARFRFACDLEAHLAAESAGPAQRAGLPLPHIAGSASPEEMTARHKAFRALCARVEAYRAAAPFEDWDTGVFRLEPRTGCAREIRELEVAQDWGLDIGRRVRLRLILERHGEDLHVCVLEHSLSQAPLTLAARDGVARSLAAEFLAKRRGWLERLRRKTRLRLMVHVIVRPFQSHGGERRVREEEILRDGSGSIQVVETGVVRGVLPLMVREILDMDPALRQAVRG
jgi:hypothetical protein